MSMIARPTTTRIARTTRPATALFDSWLRGGVGHDDHRRAVRDDLGHRVRDLAAVEAHRDDRVGAHDRRVLDEAVDRLAAGILEQLGGLMDLAPDERAKSGDEVPGEPPAADDEPEGLALRLGDPMAGDERR